MMFDKVKFTEIRDFLKKNTDSCQIIAISKNHPKEAVIEAIKSGVFIFGENRVMEAKNKFDDIKKNFPNIELHLTGPLQSNKVKLATSLFDVFHTLDREKIAIEFSKYREKIVNKKIYIQVNTGKEKSKSGILPEHLGEFINFCKVDKKLNIIGLMCIPPIEDKPGLHFEMLKKLAKKNNLEQISIGMSGDYLEAAKYNPTYVRLGTILFGKRN